MKHIILSLKYISIWRWTIFIIMIFGLSLSNFSSLIVSGILPSFYEIVLMQINNPSVLMLYFIFLIIIVDLGFSQKIQKNQDSTNSKICNYITLSIIISFILVLLIALSALLTLLLKEPFINFINKWQAMPTMEVQWLTPLTSIAFSIPLFIFRFAFITILIIIINSQCKKTPWGYLGGFLICLIDSVAYYNFSLEKPIGFLPFEHAYLDSVFNLTAIPILDFSLSVLYWIMLLAITGFVFCIIERKKNCQVRTGGLNENNYI